MDTYFLENYARIRQKEFVEEARLARLIQEMESQEPSFWQKLTWQVGNWLIILGHKLREDNFRLAEIDYGTAKSGHQKHYLHSK